MSIRIRRAFLHTAAALLLFAASAHAARTTLADAASNAAKADVRMETSTPTGRAALLAEASRKGSIPVVVSLKLDKPWVPEERLKARVASGAWRLDALPKSQMAAGVADPKGFDPVTTQRADVAATQAAVLGAVSKSAGASTVRKYNVPAISLTVTRAELDKLLANPKVAHVAIEKDLSMHLSETVHTIAAASSDLSGYSGAGWTVAVIDSGVSGSHPFLQGKVVDEACFSTGGTPDHVSLCPSGVSPQYGSGSGTNCDFSLPGCAHGTHVAGIAAGKAGCTDEPGSCGFDGVARDATIMAIQVFHRNPSELYVKANMADVRSALEYVYNSRDRFKIASVNLSLGGGLYAGECDTADPATTQTMENLRAANIAVVISTGNENATNGVGLPACLSPAIAVSGSQGDGVWSSDSATGSNNSTRTDLFAPSARAGGAGVLSAYIKGGDGTPTWEWITGTSMAAPHVAGAFAVLRQRNPAMSVAAMQSALENTGKAIVDTRAGAGGVSHPRINLAAALLAVSDQDQDNDGLPDALESGEGRNASVKDNDVFSVPRLFALQQYRDFFAREGSSSEVSTLAWGLGSGSTTRTKVIQDLLGSNEYQIAGFVTRLYLAYFLRLPDYPGQMYWMTDLREGATQASVSAGFANSPEFQQRYGNLDNSGFVTQLYRNVLEREPEPAGLAYWKQKLDSGEYTRGGVMIGFSESNEFRARTTNDVFVATAYMAMLRRVPTNTEFDTWTQNMDQGTPGSAVITSLLGSGEYRVRFLP